MEREKMNIQWYPGHIPLLLPIAAFMFKSCNSLHIAEVL